MENNSEVTLRHQKTSDFLQRLQSIANKINDYNNTISPERAYNMLYDEVTSLSTEIMLTKDTNIFSEKMYEYCLFIQRKWQEFYETYSSEDLNRVLKGLYVKQNDTKIHGTRIEL